MAFESTGSTCPNCGTQLTSQEIELIENGSVIRCRGCSYIVSRDGAYPAGVSSGPTASDSYTTPVTPGYQKQQGGIGSGGIFFIGLIVFSLGLYSWIFYIPLFSDFYFGELFGAILLFIGLRGIWRETTNPSGIWILLGGLVLWIAGWLSWLIYIPVLSDFYFGEIGGLILMVFGYQKLKQ